MNLLFQTFTLSNTGKGEVAEMELLYRVGEVKEIELLYLLPVRE